MSYSRANSTGAKFIVGVATAYRLNFVNVVVLYVFVYHVYEKRDKVQVTNVYNKMPFILLDGIFNFLSLTYVAMPNHAFGIHYTIATTRI